MKIEERNEQTVVTINHGLREVTFYLYRVVKASTSLGPEFFFSRTAPENLKESGRNHQKATLPENLTIDPDRYEPTPRLISKQ